MDIQANYIHLEQFNLFDNIPRSVLEEVSNFTTLRSRPKNSYVYHAYQALVNNLLMHIKRSCQSNLKCIRCIDVIIIRYIPK